MRMVYRLTILGVCFGLAALADAQPPDDKSPPPPRRGSKDRGASPDVADSIVSRMMAFDKNKDGKLSRDEITDRRLIRVFERADTNKDGVVTKEELTALAKKMAEENNDAGRRRGGFGPPDGPDRPGRGGPGGPGGPGGGGRGGSGGVGGPPRPGQILPPPLQDILKLSADQKKQLDALQKEVDGKLAKILTEEQKKQLKDMREGFRRGGPPPEGENGGPRRPPR